VGVHHRRTDVRVAEQLLDGPNVIAGLQQMRRERMAERVAAHTLGHARPSGRLGHGALDLGYFDDETCRLEPIENPFGPKLLPIRAE
jgi:hypothetical protein